jgi:hypothetical protein
VIKEDAEEVCRAWNRWMLGDDGDFDKLCLAMLELGKTVRMPIADRVGAERG